MLLVSLLSNNLSNYERRHSPTVMLRGTPCMYLNTKKLQCYILSSNTAHCRSLPLRKNTVRLVKP